MQSRTHRRLLLSAFALSGFSGLIYESLWTHYLKLFLGHAAYAQTLVLAIFMAGVVGSIDNILRPRLVGRDTQMHEILILLSTLGGIVLFGVVGFIIGPIVAALFVTIWDLYGMAFRDVLPPSPEVTDRPPQLYPAGPGAESSPPERGRMGRNARFPLFHGASCALSRPGSRSARSRTTS